jgi:hypothetical protein
MKRQMIWWELDQHQTYVGWNLVCPSQINNEGMSDEYEGMSAGSFVQFAGKNGRFETRV